MPAGAEGIYNCHFLGSLQDAMHWVSGLPISEMDDGHVVNSIRWLERNAKQIRSEHREYAGYEWKGGAQCSCPPVDDLAWVRCTPVYLALVEERDNRRVSGRSVAKDPNWRSKQKPPTKRVAPKRPAKRIPWTETPSGVVCSRWVFRMQPHEYGPGKVHYVLATPEHRLFIACNGRYANLDGLIDFDPEEVTCLKCIPLPSALEQGQRPNWRWEEKGERCSHT